MSEKADIVAEPDEPKVRRVIIHICEPCIRGEGQECHTPGCALFLHRVDLPIHEELLEDAESALATAEATTLKRAAWRPIETAPKMRTILLFAITDTETGNWRMETGSWFEGRNAWEWGGRMLAPYETQPTHWMPLPPDPGHSPAPAGEAEVERLRAENERLRALLNTPETADWFKGVELEAAHQQERFGAEHDAGKTALDWFWLIGFLAQKAAYAHLADDDEKAKHHTISTGAALLNWHRQISGSAGATMRPGIDPSALASSQAKREGQK